MLHFMLFNIKYFSVTILRKSFSLFSCKLLQVKKNFVPLHRFQRKALLIKEFWRGGRVVDCGGLENRCTARYPGFESLSLR